MCRYQRWKVGRTRTGADRVTKRFDPKREAIEVARELARKQKTELYIHGTDGLIRERVSYGEDLLRQKG